MRYTILELVSNRYRQLLTYIDILPDVVCDWRYVSLKELPSADKSRRSNRVAVSGAKGRPPTSFFKVSATTFDGFRLSGSLMIGGIDAAKKARAVGEAILKKTRRMMAERGFDDYLETNLEILGAEHSKYNITIYRIDTLSLWSSCQNSKLS
jgi:hypothetical protein